jgi:hypothetical protein
LPYWKVISYGEMGKLSLFTAQLLQLLLLL